MSTHYHYEDEYSTQVNETSYAYNANVRQIESLWEVILKQSVNVQVALKERLDSLLNPTLPNYTAEELDLRLKESEDDFRCGRVLSMDEADRDMDNFIKGLV